MSQGVVYNSVGRKDAATTSVTVPAPEARDAAEYPGHRPGGKLVLVSYALLTAHNQMCWITFAPVKDKTIEYYNMPADGNSAVTVDLASSIYMLVYLTLFLPVAFFLAKVGLKNGLYCSAAVNAIGALVRFIATTQRSFAGVLVGQTMCAISQTLTFSLPGTLAAEWFPRSRSRAVGMAWSATYLGVALGLWFPPLMVSARDHEAYFGGMMFLYAVVGAAILIFTVMSYRWALAQLPPHQEHISSEAETIDIVSFGRSLCSGLLVNTDYMILNSGFGITLGTTYSIATELQTIFAGVLESDAQIGSLGLIQVVAGTIGTSVAGAVLSAHPSKAPIISLALTILGFFGMLGILAGIATQSVFAIFLFATFYGFGASGMTATALEHSAAITPGVSEFVSSSMMMASVQLYGLIFTLIVGAMAAPAEESEGTKAADREVLSAVGFICTCTFVGVALSGIIIARAACSDGPRHRPLASHDAEVGVDMRATPMAYGQGSMGEEDTDSDGDGDGDAS